MNVICARVCARVCAVRLCVRVSAACIGIVGVDEIPANTIHTTRVLMRERWCEWAVGIGEWVVGSSEETLHVV